MEISGYLSFLFVAELAQYYVCVSLRIMLKEALISNEVSLKYARILQNK